MALGEVCATHVAMRFCRSVCRASVGVLGEEQGAVVCPCVCACATRGVVEG